MDLEKVKILCRILLGTCIVFFLALAFTFKPVWGYFAIAAMGIYGVLIVMFWRCPKCGENLGPLPLGVKCCPNCGEKIS